MESIIPQLKENVISACRILSHQKLVEGFGHVSARIPQTELFIMTPRVSLALVTQEELLTMNLQGQIVEGTQTAPFEAWLHTAIMKAKPTVNAGISGGIESERTISRARL